MTRLVFNVMRTPSIEKKSVAVVSFRLAGGSISILSYALKCPINGLYVSRVAILSAPNTPISTIASFESSESDHSKSMSDSIARLSRLTGYFSMLCSAYCFVHWPDDWITQNPSFMKSIHEDRLIAATVNAGDMLKTLGSMIEGVKLPVDIKIAIWSYHQ